MVQESGLRAEGAEFREEDFRFQVWGSRLSVWGRVFRVHRVEGLLGGFSGTSLSFTAKRPPLNFRTSLKCYSQLHWESSILGLWGGGFRRLP